MRSRIIGTWTGPALFTWAASVTMAGGIGLCLLLIGHRTGFASVYSLDDAYIHLAMAEEILHGNYGVNTSEVASASSSILYPFLLALLLSAGFGQFGPLIVNVAASFCVVILLGSLIGRMMEGKASKAAALLMGALSVIGFNLVGLALTGMEHSLQVLVTLLALYGLMQFKAEGQVRPWWILSVVAAPFIRFEGLAVLCLTIVFLLCQRRVVPALVCLAAVGAGMAVWGVVMSHLDLPVLPSSVLTKLSPRSQGGAFFPLVGLQRNLVDNLDTRAGFVLFALAALLLWRARPTGFVRSLKKSGPQHVGPAAALFSAGLIFAHLLGGKTGWFARYEAYVLITGLVCLLVVFFDAIASRNAWWRSGFIAWAAVLLGPNMLATLRTPEASTNIFAQQYQMHRLAADILGVPVGVNDLGWVSFQNDHYVLDLWGLGSETARQARMGAASAGGGSTGWMSDLARSKGVRVAMIYESWLSAPDDWIKVGELDLDMPKITAAEKVVSVFVLDRDILGSVTTGLERLKDSLPPEASLRIRKAP